MHRTPLPENHCIRMENGGEYIIRRKIAEGGFSLVYEAETLGGTAPVVIKEYFPAEGAFRNNQNKVCPLVGYEERFLRNLEQFNNEGVTGGLVAQYSFQTVSFLSCGNGYALMQEESQDMVSVSDLVAGWSECPPIPYTGNLKDADPVFTDLTRLKYSLRVIESVLSVLSTIHERGYLHLDLSSRNVLWADSDSTTGRIGAAIITDYGCSVNLSDGVYQPNYLLSYSPGFAVPEIQKGLNQLSPATDIYSVGMLLFFLCVGSSALEISHNRKHQVVREASYLKLPQRIKDCLVDIICTAITDKECRYPSAYVMREEIRKLDEKIPTHPINPDNTNSFTLYSLKSMLEGSMKTHYSWAHELCDRRKKSVHSLDDTIRGLSFTSFSSDSEFLQAVLPDTVFQYVKCKLVDSPYTIADIMTGNFPDEWKEQICLSFKQDSGVRFNRLLKKSNNLLTDKRQYWLDCDILFELLGDDGVFLRRCHQRSVSYQSSYIGLALLTVYALVGSQHFQNHLFYSDGEVMRYFTTKC